MRWTKAFRRAAGKEVAFDTTFQFERRRNRPVKYDRDLIQTTTRVIKKVDDIKAKRSRQFYENRYRINSHFCFSVSRMKAKKKIEKEEALGELRKSIDLIPAAAARDPTQLIFADKVKAKLDKRKKMEIE